MNRDQILTRLRHLATIAGSQRALAAKMEVSEMYLSDVLRERRPPGPAVLKFLGLTKTYSKEAKP